MQKKAGAFAPALLARSAVLDESELFLGLRFSWFLAAEMKAGELDDGLGHLHFDAVNFLVESRERQSAVHHYLAAFSDGLERPFAQAVPGIDIEPKGFVFFILGRKLFYCDREFDHLVAGISEGDRVGGLGRRVRRS